SRWRRLHNKLALLSPRSSSGKLLEQLVTSNQKNVDFHNDVKRHRRWPLGAVKRIHITRYLLRFSAVEIFFSSSYAPVFLNFSSPLNAKDVATRLANLTHVIQRNRGENRERSSSGGGGAGGAGGGAGVGGSIWDGVLLVDKRRALDLAERAKAAWRRREMCNFEYLMVLNTLAGRSYNDLMQYPVFPWVVADYTSEELDLNNPDTFRDLSKPIGALDEKRFQMFEDRYHGFADPDIPSFFYGSHYSTAGIVLFFLLRMEPFATLNVSLQGGKFDHADRLFHSVASAWANCLSNTSDVKELIPEFYYHPEFLVNKNGYFLGVRQDGQGLGDVVLPPWAKGSPETFVRRSREALECEYVSSRLHEWVDLIFGFRQRGQEAIDAGNVFYYLTYEGSVDLDAITNPFERASVEDQIANFGQTPLQLFRKPHPRRGPPVPVLRPLLFSPSSLELTSQLPPPALTSSSSSSASASAAASPSALAASSSGGGAGVGSGASLSSGMGQPGEGDVAVVFVGLVDGKAVTLTKGQLLSLRYWISPYTQSGASFTFSGSVEPYIGFGDSIFLRRIGAPISSSVEATPNCFDILQPPTAPSTSAPSYLLTCGHWDNSFRCVSLSDGKVVRTIRAHNDVVTCLAVSAQGTSIVTGSADTTVMVWEVERTARSRPEHVVYDKPRLVLCGHDDAVTCIAVRSELDLVVSGSTDGTIILYTLHRGRFLRSLALPSASSSSSLPSNTAGSTTPKKSLSVSASGRLLGVSPVSSPRAISASGSKSSSSSSTQTTRGSPVHSLVVSTSGVVVAYSETDLSLHSASINGEWLSSADVSERIGAMATTACGDFLVTGGSSFGGVVVRSIFTLEEIIRFDGQGVPVTALYVAPEECILVGLQDGRILTYSVDPQNLKKGLAHYAL
ncbi:hypothetical protein CLOM_g11699, partial [Closterium sp. NIES-68]